MIEIIVRGIPAPQGSKTRGANGGLRESSKAVAPWREAVRSETQDVMEETGWPPLGGPVRVRIWLMLRRPKSHYRTGRNAHLLRDGAPAYPSGKPDLDKLERAILDGLTAGGAWKDDGQVQKMTAEKLWALDYQPVGCKIEITEVTE